MQSSIDRFVFDRVAGALQQIISRCACDLSPSTRISDDLALGRLGRMKLAICLEETFDLELSDDDVEGFTVVGDIVGHISRRYFRDLEVELPT